MTLPIFALFSVYATQVIGICNLYTFFSSTAANNYAYIELWPWLLLAFATFFLLYLFLKIPRPLGQVVALAVICYGITVVVMSLWFIHVYTLTAWVFAWGFLALTVIQACSLTLYSCSPHTVLLCCELPVLGILFLLWMHEGGVYFLPSYYLASAAIALLASFLSLGMMKMQSPTGDSDGNRPAATATALGCFVAMVGLACGFVHFASSSASAAVSKTSSLLNWLWTSFWSLLYAFFLWIISLLPTPADAAMELEAEATTLDLVELEEVSELNPYILMVLGGIACVVIVIVLLRLLFQFRNFKLGKLSVQAPYRRPTKVSKTTSIWARFKAFCRAIVSHIAFSVRLFCKRNTPQGTAILLSKIGRTRGHGRLPNESYHSYLSRLQDSCHDPRLQTLSTALDGALYSATATPCPLTAKDYRQLRSAMRTLEKVKKTKTAEST